MSNAQLNEQREALRVSLVIPMRNEAKALAEIIDSIKQQTLQPDEIILVDGGSTDNTLAVARQLIGPDPRFRVLEAGEATPGRGRNVGIAAARHEWIALTDAGIQLQSHWLEQLVATAQADPGLDIVYGNFEPMCGSFFQRCAALSYVPPEQARGNYKMRGPSIASSMVRRTVWQAVGGFPDWRAAEDLHFMDRVQALGYQAGWSPEARVFWQLQPTLRATYKRFVLYSCHNVWAGRQWDWHYGIAKIYSVYLGFLLLALFHSYWWAVLPLALATARTAKSIWKRSATRSMLQLLNPWQFILVGVILLTIDVATFVGWGKALVQQPVNKIQPGVQTDFSQP